MLARREKSLEILGHEPIDKPSVRRRIDALALIV